MILSASLNQSHQMGTGSQTKDTNHWESETRPVQKGIKLSWLWRMEWNSQALPSNNHHPCL